MQSTIYIIPGKSIGEFNLSMSSKEIIQLLNDLILTFKISPSAIGQFIIADIYSFWIQNGKINQISVSKDPNARILGLCGIGDTLGTCERLLKTKFEYESYITTSVDIKGLGMDIEDYPEEINRIIDIDAFDVRTLKVESIYIFPIDE